MSISLISSSRIGFGLSKHPSPLLALLPLQKARCTKLLSKKLPIQYLLDTKSNLLVTSDFEF
jgi:hypothetical protein